jgi:putative transcriptional regulator
MAATRVSNEIRRLRFECSEMTQQELADRAGVSRQTIVSIEKGKYSPSLELAFRIAGALGRPIEAVFRYEQDALP